MTLVRQPSVAGTFYPADPSRLRDQVEEMLDAAADAPSGASNTGSAPFALIAPHAGYLYSGPIAASAFGGLRGSTRSFRRVVVIGPSHFVPFRGIAVPEADAFDTPLGQVALHREGVEAVREVDPIVTWDEPHRREHGIEVELPFLQVVLGDFELVPLVTGRTNGEEVADVLDTVWDDHTLLVVSSDLSHFHDYETARRLDADTAEAIVGGRPQDLDEGSACGRLAIQGLMLAAARRGRGLTLLDLRNSGDTAGPREEVVGYGAFRSG